MNPLCETVALLSVADVLVVVRKSAKTDGAKGITESRRLKSTILWDELSCLPTNLKWLCDSEEPCDGRLSSTVLWGGRGYQFGHSPPYPTYCSFYAQPFEVRIHFVRSKFHISFVIFILYYLVFYLSWQEFHFRLSRCRQKKLSLSANNFL